MHHILCHRLCFYSPDNETRFGDFVYLSQAVQAICIQAESEHYRRIKDDKGAYTMGAMYWQLVSSCAYSFGHLGG